MAWENEYGILLTNKLRDGLIKTVKIQLQLLLLEVKSCKFRYSV